MANYYTTTQRHNLSNIVENRIGKKTLCINFVYLFEGELSKYMNFFFFRIKLNFRNIFITIFDIIKNTFLFLGIALIEFDFCMLGQTKGVLTENLLLHLWL